MASDKTRNRGRRAARPSLTRFYLSSDGVFNAGDRRLGQRSIGRLKRGKSSSGQTTLTIPTSVPAGAYAVLACADALRRNRETSERNNCRASATKLEVNVAPTVAPNPAGGDATAGGSTGGGSTGEGSTGGGTPGGGTPGGGGEVPGGGGDELCPEPLSPVNPDGYRLATFPTDEHPAGGQTDAQGDLYVAAGPELRIFGPNNCSKTVAGLPFEPQDIAPGPDGSYIYAVEGTTPRKLVRQADGSYQVDPTFTLDQFRYGGRDHTVEGIRIATDHSGNLFVADGVWTNNLLHTVVKFDTNGNYVTRFGEYADGYHNDASSWAQGRFYYGLAGIAVSPDGNSVYTTELGNNRVQRWDAQPDGTYQSMVMWGNTQANDPNRVGSSQPGFFASPYDVGLDAQGNVYVMNTGAAQIQKFTGSGQFITSMFIGDDPNVQDPNLRGRAIAVTADGDAISTETGRMMERVN